MSYEQDIPHEQAYVNWALRQLVRKIEMLRDLPSTAADKATFRALQRMSQAKINALDKARNKIVFGRMDMESEDTYYLGSTHVDGEEIDQPAVIDWRTPMGERFYQATISDSLGVGRRRTIKVEHEVVSDVSSEILIPGFVARERQIKMPEPPILAPKTAASVAESEAAAHSKELARAEADAQERARAEAAAAEDARALAAAALALTEATAQPPVSTGANPFEKSGDQLDSPSNDPSLDEIVAEEYGLRAPDILLADLEKVRSGNMGEIIATIQADQDRLIRTDPNVALVIQGGPGTGKTVVVLHRAAWVIYQQQQKPGFADSSVLIVGPNPRFLEYIEEVLPALGETSTVQSTVDELAKLGLPKADRPRTTVRRLDEPMAERLKGDTRLVSVIEQAVWSHVKIEKIELGFGRFTLRVPVTSLEMFVQQMRSSKVSYEESRTNLWEHIAEELGRDLVRREGVGGVSADTLQNLRQESRRVVSASGAMTRMFPSLSPRAVVKRLLQEAPFRDLVAADLTKRERTVLGLGDQKKKYQWTSADLALIDEAASVIKGQTKRFAHVVVDEAQDLSPMQWRVVSRRSAGQSATIAGDLAQATSAWSPTSWEEVGDWAGYNAPVRVTELKIGYRVPMPIMDYACRLLPASGAGVDPPQSFRSGSAPVIERARKRDLARKVAQRVEVLQETPGAVAVICDPTNEKAIRSELGSLNVDPESYTLIVDTFAKGLEFDRVIVVEPTLIARGGVSGLRRLYICLTRATKDLIVIHTRVLPAELGQPADWRLGQATAQLRTKVRDGMIQATAGTQEWRAQVAEEYPHAYRRWTEAEEDQLAGEVQQGLSIEEIAELHERRVGGIRTRIKKLGLKA